MGQWRNYRLLKRRKTCDQMRYSVLKDLNKYCFDEFKLHYECLEQNNQYFSRCRASEGVLSKCVFDNLKLVKKIPGVEEQIQDKKNPIYGPDSKDVRQTKEFLKKHEATATATPASATAPAPSS